LPRLYQQAFVGTNGLVRVVDRERGRDFQTGPANAFVQRDYYTVASVDAEVDHELVERNIYGRAESIVAGPLSHLRKAFPPSLQDRMDLAGFMALQVTRGPHHRRFADHAAQQMEKASRMAAAMAPPEYWQRQRVEWEAARRAGPEPPGPFTDEERALLVRDDLVTVRATQQHAIEMSFAAVEELTSIFFLMDWRMVTFAEACLFSGPLPITYWRRPDPSIDHMGIGPITADEVIFVVGPSRAVVLAHPPYGTQQGTVGTRDREIRGRREIAAHINWNTLLWNDELLLMPDVRDHPLPVTVEQATRSWIALRG
jgi:hypothetical protein